MAVSGTVFRCGNCAAVHPGAAPGQQTVCPYCGARQVFAVPTAGMQEIQGTVTIQGGLQISGGGSLVIQGGGLVIKGGSSDFKSNELLQAWIGDVRFAFDPAAGFFVVGLHGDEDETPNRKLRAIDAWGRRLLWETELGLSKLESDHHAIRNGRYYTSADGLLQCRDLRTGQPLWQAQLPDEPKTDYRRGIELLDPYAAEAPQATIVVATEDEKATAYDRATGQPRWQVPLDDFWSDPMLEGPGVIGASTGSALRLYSPLLGPQPILSVPTESSCAMTVVGTQLLAAGSSDVLVADLASGRLLFHGKPGEDAFDWDTGLPVLAGGLLWMAADEALSGHPKGRVMQGAPMPGYKIQCLGTTGDTLMALVKKDPGTPRQALLAFEPTTLAPKYGQQDLGVFLEDAWDDRRTKQIPTSGPYTLIVAKGAELEGNETTDLYGIDGRNGAILWKQNLPGEVDRMEVTHGYFQLRTDRQVLLLRPDTGQKVAKFPWND